MNGCPDCGEPWKSHGTACRPRRYMPTPPTTADPLSLDSVLDTLRKFLQKLAVSKIAGASDITPAEGDRIRDAIRWLIGDRAFLAARVADLDAPPVEDAADPLVVLEPEHERIAIDLFEMYDRVLREECSCPSGYVSHRESDLLLAAYKLLLRFATANASLRAELEETEARLARAAGVADEWSFEAKVSAVEVRCAANAELLGIVRALALAAPGDSSIDALQERARAAVARLEGIGG